MLAGLGCPMCCVAASMFQPICLQCACKPPMKVWKPNLSTCAYGLKDWTLFALLDGQAGPRTPKVLDGRTKS